jgi:hypothetical protein
MRPCLNGNQIWTARIRAPGSTAHMGFRSPPAFLPLSGGGGGPESRAHLFNGYDRSARINDAQGDSGPPPAFLPLSGGGGGSGIDDASLRRLQFERPDQRRPGHPDIHCHSAFNQRGAPLCCVILPSVLHLTTRSLSHLIIHSPPAMCPALFHVSLPLKCVHYISSPAPFAYCLPPCVFSCNLSHTLIVSVLPLPLCAPSFALASTPIHQAIQLIHVAARKVFHVAKVPSWPGHPQSQ